MTEHMTMRHLLVPTDFSDPAVSAVEYAAFLARRLDARVTLLHAMELMPRDGEMQPVVRAGQEESERLARRGLEELHATLLEGVRTHARIATSGGPAAAILNTSRAAAADLIVMGTRGHSRLETALLGSVAAAVIRESDVPVLTVRPSAQPRIERILCPVNYSAAAAAAFQQALFFASAFDAELIALYFDEVNASNEEIESELKRMRTWIGEVPLSVRLSCIARLGEAGSQTSEFAQAHGIDLIVLGAHQTRRGPATTIGSTTDALTRRAMCPVLTVPAGRKSRIDASADRLTMARENS